MLVNLTRNTLRVKSMKSNLFGGGGFSTYSPVLFFPTSLIFELYRLLLLLVTSVGLWLRVAVAACCCVAAFAFAVAVTVFVTCFGHHTK